MTKLGSQLTANIMVVALFGSRDLGCIFDVIPTAEAQVF